MSINTDDGAFALDCWEDPEAEDVEAVTEYSDSLTELRARADDLLKAKRYGYLVLSRWNDTKEDWDELEVLTA